MEIKGITLDPNLFIKKEKKEKKENLLHLSTYKSPIEEGDTSGKVTLPRALKMHEGVRTTEPKIPKKRVITTTENWKFSTEQLNPVKQLEYVKQIIDNNIVDENPCKFIKQQIQQKLGGYKAQDLKKKKYNENLFIKHNQVLQLMIEVENQCYYCKGAVHVLYENVREPKQWTLERLDNDHGHNDGNVVIACLACNLRRRTMHPERYLFTKQLTISKLS